MPSISVPAAIIGAGALGGVTSLVGGSMSAGAAKDAASAQARAAEAAQQATLQMFYQTQANLQPWMAAGQTGLNALMTGLGMGDGTGPVASGSLTARFNPTMADLAATPGYQFTLDQGLKATQNSFAAQGLGSSGAALKGAANYAEGLAGTTYQQQFNNYLTQNQQLYNMLSGISGSGQNAAANLGGFAMNAAGQLGQSLGQMGAAQAAGIVGSNNALVGGLSGLGNSLGSSGLLMALNNQGMFGSGLGGGANALTGLIDTTSSF